MEYKVSDIKYVIDEDLKKNYDLIKKYSFYNIYDLEYMITKLSSYYEGEEFFVFKDSTTYNVSISNNDFSKSVLLDKNYLDFNFYDELDDTDISDYFAFGPRNSIYKSNVDEKGYIQDFFDFLYVYRRDNDNVILDYDLMDWLMEEFIKLNNNKDNKFNNNKGLVHTNTLVSYINGLGLEIDSDFSDYIDFNTFKNKYIDLYNTNNNIKILFDTISRKLLFKDKLDDDDILYLISKLNNSDINKVITMAE